MFRSNVNPEMIARKKRLQKITRSFFENDVMAFKISRFVGGAKLESFFVSDSTSVL